MTMDGTGDGGRRGPARSVLVDLVAHSMDEEYEDAARRRRAGNISSSPGGGPPSKVGGASAPARGDGGAPQRERLPRVPRRPLTRSVPFMAAIVAVGVLLAVSAVEARTHQPAASQQRAALIDRIHNATKNTDELDTRAEQLRADVAKVRGDALSRTAAGDLLSAQVDRLSVVTGGEAVTGPGLEVVLDDAPNAHDGSADSDLGIIYDRDLQSVVNALWAAGAEAIAINGQRLTATTAIRSAGQAILVDFRPLTRPYVIDAIGNPDALPARFADSATGRLFKSWRQIYGLRFAISRQAGLTLPGAGNLTLHYAEPMDSQ